MKDIAATGPRVNDPPVGWVHWMDLIETTLFKLPLKLVRSTRSVAMPPVGFWPPRNGVALKAPAGSVYLMSTRIAVADDAQHVHAAKKISTGMKRLNGFSLCTRRRARVLSTGSAETASGEPVGGVFATLPIYLGGVHTF